MNLQEKFSMFTDHWNPRVVGSLNGQQIKLAKFKGDFVWYKHDQEDEMFLVIKGSFVMEFRDKKVALKEGEFLIVPSGVEHRPVAIKEAEVMIFEPATTINTGDKQDKLTRTILENL